MLVLVGKHPSQFQSRLGGQAQPTLRRAMPAAGRAQTSADRKNRPRAKFAVKRDGGTRAGGARGRSAGEQARPQSRGGRVQGKAGGCRRHACSARPHRPRRHRPPHAPAIAPGTHNMLGRHTCGCRAMASGCPAARRAGLKLLPSMPAIAPATGFPPPVLAFPPFLPPTSYFFFPRKYGSCPFLMVRDCRSLRFRL